VDLGVDEGDETGDLCVSSSARDRGRQQGTYDGEVESDGLEDEVECGRLHEREINELDCSTVIVSDSTVHDGQETHREGSCS
jgi:hypothetical protein